MMVPETRSNPHSNLGLANPTLPNSEHSRAEFDLTWSYRIEPGAIVNLCDFNPRDSGGYRSNAEALPEIRCQIEKLDRLQKLMHAERKRSLLIVLQGLDACGKDGLVRHIFTGMNPAGCRVATFRQPTPDELAHDFLWRVHAHVPGKGETVIFNRSHYEDVLVVRVHHLVSTRLWSKRYDLINDLERLVSLENGTTVLKFFLHISKEEQLARFKRRLEDPYRNWKISESDYKEREYWDDYMLAFEDMLQRTSTPQAPWFVIPSDHKWFRDVAVSQIITRTLEQLRMELPPTAVDLDRIRRRYHGKELEVRVS
jgi:PPK2 family polyphosphate:nucleotide phosphotransferase